MQNYNTLLELGFKHHKEWDSEDVETKHYKLDFNNKIFRAIVYDASCGFPNKLTFVTIGIVVNGDKVDRWRDRCSDGSVGRFINKLF